MQMAAYKVYKVFPLHQIENLCPQHAVAFHCFTRRVITFLSHSTLLPMSKLVQWGCTNQTGQIHFSTATLEFLINVRNALLLEDPWFFDTTIQTDMFRSCRQFPQHSVQKQFKQVMTIFTFSEPCIVIYRMFHNLWKLLQEVIS